MCSKHLFVFALFVLFGQLQCAHVRNLQLLQRKSGNLYNLDHVITGYLQRKDNVSLVNIFRVFLSHEDCNQLIDVEYTLDRDKVYCELLVNAAKHTMDARLQYCIFLHLLRQKIQHGGIQSIFNTWYSTNIIIEAISLFDFGTEQFIARTMPLWNNFIAVALSSLMHEKPHYIKLSLKPVFDAFLSLFKVGHSKDDDEAYLNTVEMFAGIGYYVSEDTYLTIINKTSVSIDKKQKHFENWLRSKDASTFPIRHDIFNSFIQQLVNGPFSNKTIAIEAFKTAKTFVEHALDDGLCNSESLCLILDASSNAYDVNPRGNRFTLGIVHQIWTLLVAKQCGGVLIDKDVLNATHKLIQKVEFAMSGQVAFLVDMKQIRALKQWSGFGGDATRYSSFDLKLTQDESTGIRLLQDIARQQTRQRQN